MRKVKKKNAMKPVRAAGEKRREAIMEAAWKLFMKKGFAAVTVDEIVKSAGGSKSSVYDFFGGKEGLFFAIIESVTNKVLSGFELPETKGATVREALSRIGFRMGREILTEKGVGLYRLSVSVSSRYPQIARLFYENGPMTAQKALAAFFKKEAATGRLMIKDPRKAADVFTTLLIEFDHMAMSLACGIAPTDAQLKKKVGEIVDIFLAIYRVGGSGGR